MTTLSSEYPNEGGQKKNLIHWQTCNNLDMKAHCLKNVAQLRVFGSYLALNWEFRNCLKFCILMCQIHNR